MGAGSKIQWLHRARPDGSLIPGYSWSPWRGCAKVSDGCAHCYAERESKRRGVSFGVWGDNGVRTVASDSYWQLPLRWNREAQERGERSPVFPSLCDPFEDRLDLVVPRRRLWRLIEETPNLDWLLLTKRPENIEAMRPSVGSWPWSNVWLGASVENQEQADKRIPVLLQIPAAVRFVSAEPLLEPIRLDCYGLTGCPTGWLDEPGIDWLIVGGESGPGARPFDVAWARDLRDQCRAAGVPFFLKQLGANPFIEERDLDAIPNRKMLPDGRLRLDDTKGGDPAEWPEDLRVREFPQKATA